MPKNTMPAVAWPSFWTHTERVASFSRKPKSKFAWPHGPEYSVTPESLARAGFYSKNSASRPDSVVCFACPTSLSGWCSGDDALNEHIQHAAKFGAQNGIEFCWYAEIMLAERERQHALDSSNPPVFSRNPKGEKMEYCRLLSFGEMGERWIHQDKRGWIPSAARLSEAGFYFNGVKDSPDSVTCAYCEYEVEGWEKNDDPFKIHFEKRPSCPFFTYIHPEQEEPVIPQRTTSENTKSKSTTTEKKKTQRAPKKSKAARIDTDRDVSEARLSAVDEDAEDEEKVGEILGVPTSNPRKTRSKRSGLSKSTNSAASLKRSAPSRVLSNLSLASAASSAEANDSKLSKSTNNAAKNNLNTSILSIAPSTTSSVPPSPPASVATEDTSRRIPSPAPTENSTIVQPKKRGRPPKGAAKNNQVTKSKTVLGVNDPNRSQAAEDEEIMSISQLSLNSLPPPKTKSVHEEPPSPSPRKDKLTASSSAKISASSHPSGSPTPKPDRKVVNGTDAQLAPASPLNRVDSSKSVASSSLSSSKKRLSTDKESLGKASSSSYKADSSSIGRGSGSKDTSKSTTVAQELSGGTEEMDAAPPLPEKDKRLLNGSTKSSSSYSLFNFRYPRQPQSNSVLPESMYSSMEISEEDGKMTLIEWIERLKRQKMEEARQICQRDLEEFDAKTDETRSWIQKVAQQAWSN